MKFILIMMNDDEEVQELKKTFDDLNVSNRTIQTALDCISVLPDHLWFCNALTATLVWHMICFKMFYY